MSAKNPPPPPRRAKPIAVLKLWEAVTTVRQQKQFADINRVTGYLSRTYQWREDEAQYAIDDAVADGLLTTYPGIRSKGSKAGEEQIGYKMAEGVFERGGRDWYCFKCHNPGQVVQCSGCWRVAHTLCLPDGSMQCGKFSCGYCAASLAHSKKWDSDRLKMFLGFIVSRLKEKGKELYVIDQEQCFGNGCCRLIYNKMDLKDIEANVEKKGFSYLAEIVGDVHNILHNMCLCLGDDHTLAAAALACLNDCKAEIMEIERCHNCYFLYNTKPENWFIQVCDPPHELVYAKMKGYPYWPSLLISRDDQGHVVRFFGGLHQRGIVPPENIKPITADPKELGAKTNASFTKACNELRMHQNLRGKILQDGGCPPSLKSSNSCDESSSSSSDLVSSTQDTAGAQLPALAVSPQRSMQLVLSDSSASSSGPATKKAKLSRKITATPSQSTSAIMPQNSRDVQAHESSEHQLNVEKALKQLEDKLRKKHEKEVGESVARVAQEAEHKRLEDLRKQRDDLAMEHAKLMQDLNAKHKEEISAVKKKQWCYNCESAAIYHCCWNTAYCSVECQQAHWHKEHKRACRRKR